MKDDNDRYLQGTLPLDPFADTECLDASAAGVMGVENPNWGAPLPICPIAYVPSFPVEVLPGWFRNWVIAHADALQCPVDLPAMLGFSILSVSSAKKFEVLVRSGWREPINTYVAVALEPGESKSPVFKAATQPVNRFVDEQQKRLAPEIRAAKARADIAAKCVGQLKSDAAKACDPAERAKLLAQLDDALEEQAAIQIPVKPRLILDDVTAESLEVVLRQQGGRIAVLSDEGGPFEIMGGRYTDGIPNIEIYQKGYSGSAISTDRIGREGGSVRNPSITMGLAIQPDVITSLREKKGFRGRGLLDRFLWSIPRSLVGSRVADPPPVADEVHKSYEQGVTALLEISADKDGLGEIIPRSIPLTKKAYALFVEFKKANELMLRPSGELESIKGWGNKLPGTVVRIAGLLHLADRVGETSARMMEPIGEGEMRRAIRIAEYLRAHARIAFDMIEADPIARKARYILEWIERKRVATFTLREAYMPLRARFRTPAKMNPPLELLIDLRVIRLRPSPPRSGPGRRPSPIFDVNPAIHAQNAQNSASGSPDGSSVRSVQSFGTSAPDSPAVFAVTQAGVTGGDQDV